MEARERRGYKKGRRKRAEILEKALELISREGYQKSTLRQLGNVVGLTNAGLLHHFASKEDLFCQVLKKRDELSLQQYEREKSFLRKLVSIMRDNQAVPGLSLLYNSLLAEAVSPDHAAHDFFVNRFSSTVEDLLPDVSRARPDWDEHKCRQISRTLIAAADGLQAQWLLDPNIDVPGHLEALLESLGLDS